MKEPGFKEGYDSLGEEFALASMLIAARAKAKLSQEELAEQMGTSQSTLSPPLMSKCAVARTTLWFIPH